MKPGESFLSPNRIRASTGYFAAMGVTLLSGRLFDDHDGPDVPHVVILDDSLGIERVLVAGEEVG